MRNMNRKEKLKVLQAIKDGKISPESLLPPQVYIFVECYDRPGIYEHNGKEYNETEYREFCERINRKNNGNVILNEGRQFPKEDTIIKLCYTNHLEVNPNAKRITLNLDTPNSNGG